MQLLRFFRWSCIPSFSPSQLPPCCLPAALQPHHLPSGRELVAEMARKREAERARFASLGAEVTGQGAGTVYRDRETGRQMSKEEIVAEREKEKAKKAAPYEDESQLAWGGGLKQREEARAAAQALAEEAAKPFARWVGWRWVPGAEGDAPASQAGLS